jgi:ATP-dependent helicase/nuclease subunit A
MVLARLNWCYGYDEAVKLPSKLAVTRIKKLKSGDINTIHRDEVYMAKKPGFCEPVSSLSAREKGTAMHFVMQHLDFTRASSTEHIRDQIRVMVERELLLPRLAEAVDVLKILEFCQSDLGQRAAAAKDIRREVPFNLRCGAERIFENLPECHEQVLIQGVIDLFFTEEDELVLVDFKTDRITPDNYDDLLNQYRVQLELYREALQNICGRQVKETYLYFFDSGSAIRI